MLNVAAWRGLTPLPFPVLVACPFFAVPLFNKDPCMHLYGHLIPHVQALSTLLRNLHPLDTCQVQGVPTMNVLCLWKDLGKMFVYALEVGLGLMTSAHPFI